MDTGNQGFNSVEHLVQHISALQDYRKRCRTFNVTHNTGNRNYQVIVKTPDGDKVLFADSDLNELEAYANHIVEAIAKFKEGAILKAPA